MKASLAASEEEAAQSVEGGYNACLDRLRGAGFDLAGHEFSAYCGDLAQRLGGDGGLP